MRRINRIGRMVFGATVLSVLGAGVSVALARPADASEPVCRTYQCRTDCIAGGALGGVCSENTCECFY